MDEGAGPVRASNPGTNRTRGLLEDLNEKIDRADYDSARSTVRSIVESPIFDRFRAEPRGDMPVGVSDRQVCEWIGARTFLVLLPDRVMLEQDGRHANADLPGHPELTMDDYRRLPALLERPDFVFRAKPHRSTAKGTLDRRWNLAGQVGGRAYHAVIERDAAARKVEVISFHRIEPRKIRSMLKRADSFREEKRKWDCAW